MYPNSSLVDVKFYCALLYSSTSSSTYPLLVCLVESWVELGGAAPQRAARQEELIDLIADAAKEDTRLK